MGKFNKGDFHDSMKIFTYVCVHYNKGHTKVDDEVKEEFFLEPNMAFPSNLRKRSLECVWEYHAKNTSFCTANLSEF